MKGGAGLRGILASSSLCPQLQNGQTWTLYIRKGFWHLLGGASKHEVGLSERGYGGRQAAVGAGLTISECLNQPSVTKAIEQTSYVSVAQLYSATWR